MRLWPRLAIVLGWVWTIGIVVFLATALFKPYPDEPRNFTVTVVVGESRYHLYDYCKAFASMRSDGSKVALKTMPEQDAIKAGMKACVVCEDEYSDLMSDRPYDK